MCHTNLLKGTNFRKKDNGSIHIHIYFCLIFQHLILWKFVDSHIYLLALKEDSGALSEMAPHYHNIHWGTHFNTLIFSPPSVHNKCSESCCAVILCVLGGWSVVISVVFISLITLISSHWLLDTIAYIAHTTTGASAPWMHRKSSDSGWLNCYIKFLNNFWTS